MAERTCFQGLVTTKVGFLGVLMVIEIASLRFKISIENKRFFMSSFLANFINRCRANGASVDFSIDIKKRRPPVLPQNIGKSLNGIAYYEISDNYFIFKVHNVLCSVMLDKKTAELYSEDKKTIHDSDFITILKLLTSILVLERGGVSLHCSAVYVQDKGYAFCGKSGAGKTTIALRLQSKYTILSDEFNVALPGKEGGYRFFSAPFTKLENIRYFTRGSAPVSKIFLLPDGKNGGSCASGGAGKFFTTVLQHLFVFPTSDLYAGKLFDNAAALVAAVPIELITDRDELASRLLEE
jgi:hypothetical protein